MTKPGAAAVIGSLMLIPLFADTRNANSGVVVQNYYYAKPGKAEEVYQWRLHASDVRVKLRRLSGVRSSIVGFFFDR